MRKVTEQKLFSFRICASTNISTINAINNVKINVDIPSFIKILKLKIVNICCVNLKN